MNSPRSSTTRPFSVAICIDTRYSLARRRIIGVTGHGHRHGWRMTLIGTRPERVLPFLRKWQGDGVIALRAEPEVVRHLRRRGIPLVDTSTPTVKSVPYVTVDDAALGELWAEHLYSPQFASFGYCGIDDPISRRREKAFFAALRRRAREAKGPHPACSACRVSLDPLPETIGSLGEWLRSLKLPAAIAAHDDRVGVLVTHACAMERIEVPRQVAVIGATDDPILTEFSEPPLSSVAVPGRRVGLRAAEMLERLMRGGGHSALAEHLAPTSVHARRSTSAEWTVDPLVRDALKRLHHKRGDLTATEAAVALGVSRRTIERRVRAALGKTFLDVALGMRMENARRLLRITSEPLETVAKQCGFTTAASFIRAFSRHHGVPPGEFRSEPR